MSQKYIKIKPNQSVDMSQFVAVAKRGGIDPLDHQLAGVKWMVKRERCAVRGGILADDMGMGKTLQMIGLIMTNLVRNTIIIVPPMLIPQWLAAFDRFTGHLPLVYHGSAKKRITQEMIDSSPVVITSYGTMLIDKQTNTPNMLYTREWDRIICDEAHHIRNPKSRIYYSVTQLQSRFKWLVTGTMVQNKSADVVSLMRIIGVVGESPTKMVAMHAIRRTARDVGNIGGVYSGVVTDVLEEIDWGCDLDHKIAVGIHENEATFALEVVKSPAPEEDVRVVVELMGRNAINRMMPGYLSNYIMSYICEPTGGMANIWPIDVMGAPLPEKTEIIRPDEEESSHHFAMLSRLQKICLFGSSVRDRKLYGGGEEDSNFAQSKLSPKMNRIINDIYGRITNGKGKIIFTSFRQEMCQLGDELERLGVSVYRVGGDVSKAERMKRISLAICSANAAIEGEYAPVLIINIRSGNEGLNLQVFSEVYFPSPNWNPSMESQAVARCARMGQKKDVNVFRYKMMGVRSNLGARMASFDWHVEEYQDIKKEIGYEINASAAVVMKI